MSIFSNCIDSKGITIDGMYLYIIGSSLMNGIINSVWGRKVKINKIITIPSIILGIIGYYEIVICEGIVEIVVSRWIRSDWMDINLSLRIDKISMSIMLTVIIINSIVQIYNEEYISGERERLNSKLWVFVFFMKILLCGSNLIVILIGWEGIGITSYILINFWWRRQGTGKAGIKAVIINRIGDWSVMLGTIMLVNGMGSVEVMNIEWGNISKYIGLVMLLGSLGKSAQLFLITWLPDSMEGPTPVSSLIHAATLVTGGVYLTIRVYPVLIEWENIVVLCGSITSVYAGLVGIMQNDIKRVVAYSTASQMGYIIMTNGLGHNSIGLNHIINHAYFKALLFLSSGNVIHSDNNEQDLRRYGKLIKRLPMTSICIIIGTINILGLPYLSGYYSKDAILEYSIGSYRINGLNVYILGLISAIGTTVYSIIIIKKSMIEVSNNEYKDIKESNGIIGILSIISLVSGYIIKEETGIGIEEIDTHESVNIWIKLLPIICVSITALSVHSIALNVRLNIDELYNRYISKRVLLISKVISNKIDKGWLEIVIMREIKRKIWETSKRLNKIESGNISEIINGVVIGSLVGILKWEEIMLIILVCHILVRGKNVKDNQRLGTNKV